MDLGSIERPVAGDSLWRARGKVEMGSLLQARWVAATLQACLVIDCKFNPRQIHEGHYNLNSCSL